MNAPRTTTGPTEARTLATSPAVAQPPRPRDLKVRETTERFGLVILLAVLIILFSLLPSSRDQFASLANFRNTTSNAVVGGVLALAALVPLVTGEFDFSIGLNLELSAMVTAGVITRLGAPMPIGILAGLGTGLGIGMVNGFLVAVRGLNSFIATFAISTVAMGVIELYAAGTSILVPNSELTSFGLGSHRWLGVPQAVYALVVLFIVLWYVMDHTPVGRFWYAVGSNRTAAALNGLPVKRLIFSAFCASGLLSGAAGVLYVAQQGSATPNIGQGYVLPAFAAVFLGATAIRLGQFNVWGTLIALIFVAVGTTGLVFAGVSNWVQSVFQGAVLLVALSFTRSLSRSGTSAAGTGPKL